MQIYSAYLEYQIFATRRWPFRTSSGIPIFPRKWFATCQTWTTLMGATEATIGLRYFNIFQFHEISTWSDICSDLDTLKGSIRPLVEPVWAELSIQLSGSRGQGKKTISTSLCKGSQKDKDIASESQSVGNFWFWECDQSMVQQFTKEGNIRTLRRRPTDPSSTSKTPNRSTQHNPASYASLRGVGNSRQSARRPGPWSIGWAWLGSNDWWPHLTICSDRCYRENVNAYCTFTSMIPYNILRTSTVNKGGCG